LRVALRASASARRLSASVRYLRTLSNSLAAALWPDDLLLVASGYGMAPLGVPRRLVGDPVRRDTDGLARTDLFQRSFAEARPITFIPTHEP
jgi:hypothetical protein